MMPCRLLMLLRAPSLRYSLQRCHIVHTLDSLLKHWLATNWPNSAALFTGSKGASDRPHNPVAGQHLQAFVRAIAGDTSRAARRTTQGSYKASEC
eukprot:scaffold90312_cov35-Tisochrysis_lutea.AAC.3